ncbi:hypothetical protein GCM10009751_40290 [Myceligenerans crystallogenes]|uniref:Uncharacterized protein n=1 Tax=Myceligenerans crystallogenes TaxID=316335 RepID=A0ABP5A0G2_9MICO
MNFTPWREWGVKSMKWVSWMLSERDKVRVSPPAVGGPAALSGPFQHPPESIHEPHLHARRRVCGGRRGPGDAGYRRRRTAR